MGDVSGEDVLSEIYGSNRHTVKFILSCTRRYCLNKSIRLGEEANNDSDEVVNNSKKIPRKALGEGGGSRSFQTTQ